MTNLASQKRPLEDDGTVRGGEDIKRKREDSVPAKRDSKDWRDVHLKEDSHRRESRRRDEDSYHRHGERRRTAYKDEPRTRSPAAPAAAKKPDDDELEEGEEKEEGE